MAIGNIDHRREVHKALGNKTPTGFMPRIFKTGTSSFGLSTLKGSLRTGGGDGLTPRLADAL
jgi:hypothetical protein